MTDKPVGIPATCEEPIYQLTPGATVPGSPIPAICPTYPVAVETTATTATVAPVTELPNTGAGSDGRVEAGVLLLVVVLLLTGWFTLRSAGRALDEQDLP